MLSSEGVRTRKSRSASRSSGSIWDTYTPIADPRTFFLGLLKYCSYMECSKSRAWGSGVYVRDLSRKSSQKKPVRIRGKQDGEGEQVWQGYYLRHLGLSAHVDPMREPWNVNRTLRQENIIQSWPRGPGVEVGREKLPITLGSLLVSESGLQ